jgi:ParB family chromosome partitioning protein
MQKIVSVNPFRCRMWALHDRSEAHITEDSCRAEIDSFERHGQLVPALGRALQGDPDYEVELIFGARRLFVARHINKPLLVELKEMSDREAVIAMDIENRQRADISPYERGMSYAHWLRSGHFTSQDDIARALRVSSSQISRLLRLARLPSVMVNAFASPLDICESWGLDLLDALDDPHRRQPTVLKARAIGAITPRPPAREVYRAILAAAAHGRKPKAKTQDEVVKDDSGAPLFRISRRRNSVALLLPVEKLSAQTMDNIRHTIADILQSRGAQAADRGGPGPRRKGWTQPSWE